MSETLFQSIRLDEITTNETQRKPRLLGIDLVRLLAMVFMMQGHTLDALLQPSYQASGWYSTWQFVRGFTAPTFLTLSGFSFALVTVRAWDKHIVLSSTVWRRVRRFAFFVVLGYLMHFPVHRVADLRWLGVDGWKQGLQVDVLQTIGVSLLFLQALAFLARTPRRFAAISLVTSAAVILSSAFLWAAHWPGYLPIVIAAYLNGATGSIFPLFPWSAYVLLGAGLGAFYTISDPVSPRPFARRFAASGLVLAFSGVELQNLGMRLYAHFDFWHTSPTLFLTRAGVVLLVLGMALHLKQLPSRAADTVRTLAKESLLVYFVHVCLLYGSIWNLGLRQYWGGSFDLLHATFAAVLMITSMLILALAWDRCKTAGEVPQLVVRALTVAVAVWSLS